MCQKVKRTGMHIISRIHSVSVKEANNKPHYFLHHLQQSSNLIAGRPKAAILFWFFGDFRSGALLFMIILVIYKYKNR